LGGAHTLGGASAWHKNRFFLGPFLG